MNSYGQKIPKISIIIPIYNEEKYLKQCLDSVCKQTMKELEIICVDDGSTDSSPQIMDSFARKDKRIVVIHKENSGNGNSMNRGLEIATGEYIGIVESDDFIMPNMFEDLYALSEEGSVDVVKCNFWDCYDEKDGTLRKVVNREREGIPESNKSFTVREKPEILWGHPSIWSAIYRRNMIKFNNIFFKEVRGGGWVDNPFFFDTLCCAESIKWTKKPYYCYRKTSAVSSSNNYNLSIPFERMKDNLDIIAKRNHGGEDELKVAYARALMYLVGATEEKQFESHFFNIRQNILSMMDMINQDIISDDFHIWDQKNYYKYRSPLRGLFPSAGKVLIYNWVPFDDPSGAGGGVTIYCQNLIRTLVNKRPDLEVFFLSSGWAYDVSRNGCYIRFTGNRFGERCHCYEVVNSPVPAPQDMLFLNPTVAFQNSILKDTIDSFMSENGPFLAVHFNNIEGLSLDVFDLKEKYNDTRFIYSMHNYVPICMTGFYFQRDKGSICHPECASKECDQCINRNNFMDVPEIIRTRGRQNNPNCNAFDEYEWSGKMEFDKLGIKKSASEFKQFTTKATKALNTNMDCILAVSKRVKEIAEVNGIDATKIKTDYIGTKVASYQIKENAFLMKDYFKLVYLGTDIGNVEKGYPFLLEALSRIPEEIAEKIDIILTTTTKNKDRYVEKKLKSFHDVEIIHGYKHWELSKILRGANLGIIPVLWEDNLPQVAIEMVAHGIPILASDAGGASELCESEKFRFRSGDIEDFISKLTNLVNNHDELEIYFEKHHGLTTMEMHYDFIKNIYGIPDPTTIKIDINDYGKMLDENAFLYSYFSKGEGYFNDEIKRLQDENNTLRQERDKAQWHVDEMWKSKSMKIGRFITALPRKIRNK